MPEYRGGYIVRAKNNLALFNETNQGEYLVYAALEYRCAIERVVFNYLSIIDAHLPSDTEGMYRIVKMRGRILEIEPDFYRKIDFANLYLRARGNQQVPRPDLDLLNSLYGQLGGFLHTINEPARTIYSPNWWQQLSGLLSQVSTVMTPLANISIVHFTLNDAGRKLFDEFKNNTKTEDEIIKVFQVSEMMKESEHSLSPAM